MAAAPQWGGGVAHSVDLHARAGPARLVTAASSGPGTSAPTAAASRRSAVPRGRVPARLALRRRVALARRAPAGHDGVQGFVHHVGHGSRRSGGGTGEGLKRMPAKIRPGGGLCFGGSVELLANMFVDRPHPNESRITASKPARRKPEATTIREGQLEHTHRPTPAAKTWRFCRILAGMLCRASVCTSGGAAPARR